MLDDVASRVARLRLPRISQEAFQRPLELGIAVVAILNIWRLIPDFEQGHTDIVVVGLVLFVIAQVLVAAECIVPLRLTWPITLICMVAGALIVVGELGEPTNHHASWRIDIWFGVVIAFLALVRWRLLPLVLITLTTITGLVALAVAGRLDLESQTFALLFLAAPLVLLALGRLFVRQLVDEYTASRGGRTDVEEAEARSLGRDREMAAVRGQMHDTLLHCLQIVGSSQPGADRDELRSLSALALMQLDDSPNPHLGQPAELVDMLRAELGLEPCRITWLARPVNVPSHVAAALADATKESIRNVVKHCAAPIARIRVRPTSEGAQVEISDDGPGFDTSAATGRVGLKDSIVSRVEAVGGQAAVTSGPEGTTVTLTWPAPEPAPLLTAMGRQARATLSWAPLTMLIPGFAQMLSSHPGLTLWQACTVYAVLAAIVLAAMFRLRTRGFTTPQAWVLCAVAVAGVAANFWWVDQYSTDGWALWTPGIATSLVFLAIPGRRAAVAIAMAGSVLVGTGIAAVLLLGLRAAAVTHFGGIMAVLINTLFTVVLALNAAGVARHILRTEQLTAESRDRARASQDHIGLWQEWLGRARTLTAAFLSDIVLERRDPMTPETRREALWLDARVRDELRLWPGDTRVAELLDTLRRRGWDCRLDVDRLSSDLRGRIIDVLEQLPDDLRGRRLQISQREGVATLTFTPAIPAGSVSPSDVRSVIDDEDFTQVRTQSAMGGVA